MIPRCLRMAAAVLTCTLPCSFPAAAKWQALPERAPAPADNPTTAERVALGKMLFHDPRLSSKGTVSCATCHNVMAAGGDGRKTSIGIAGLAGQRNSQTVWNVAFNSLFSWDGKFPTLETQAIAPVTNPGEMGMANWGVVLRRLQAMPGYVRAYTAAFGIADAVSEANTGRALAAYQRSLITPNSRFDKFANGDRTALTAVERRGMRTFREIGCTKCHSGPAFNGWQPNSRMGIIKRFPAFHRDELGPFGFEDDLGRYQVTNVASDVGAFKVPTLRNIALTAPYFHNGAVASLSEAVRIMGIAQLDIKLTAQQVSDVVAFLKTLTGEFPEQTMPRLPAHPGRALALDD